MNAPTSASAAYEGSLPAKSAFEHPARIEDSDRSFVTRLASSSVEKLDGLITELKEMREVLRSRVSACSVKSEIMRNWHRQHWPQLRP
jgi:hypothetical protein